MIAKSLAGILLPFALAASTFAQELESTPTFKVPASELSSHVTVISYGDQRFHDPNDPNPNIANPRMRVALVNKIAEEKPDAVQMSGDVPYKGSDANDYAVFQAETAPWRDAHLRIYPALGNHETSGGEAAGIENWWKAFPELRGRRYYSVLLGDRISLIQLDSLSPLTADSAQLLWLKIQLAALPPSVDFVLISLHHPPVADIQTHIEVDHNPRPNEIALRDALSQIAPGYHAAIVVVAGHIHNYERSVVDGVTYLVSGGGGAHPYYVERTKTDLYQDENFPVFHYVKFELEADQLKATMYKVQDPTADTLVWQAKDHFIVKKK
jgi:hypothetical protein